MKKHALISIIIIAVVAVIPAMAHAAFTSSFGGRIILTEIPDVDCYDSGTGPLVIISSLKMTGTSVNLHNTGTAAKSAASAAANTVYGVYNAIPFYAEQSSSTPTAGGWILGRASIIPSFTTCDIQIGTYQIPFPVRTTSNYKTSSNSFGGSSL